MPEKSGRVYDGHQLTDDMYESTRTVFLVDRETTDCFAYLTRWENSPREREWSVFRHDPAGMDVLVETSRTYEACLMMLGARSPGLRLNFEVLFSYDPIPGQ